MADRRTSMAGWSIGAAQSLPFNVSGLKFACAYQAPKAGNISHAGLSVASIVSPPTYEIQMQSLDSSANPSGSLFSAGANVTVVPSVGFNWLALSTPAAVVKGDRFCGVFQYSSGTIGASNYANVYRYLLGAIQMGIPFSADHNGTSWTRIARRPCLCFKYDDGDILKVAAPLSAYLAAIMFSASSPNERCAIYIPLTDERCVGIKANIYFSNASSQGTLTLYDSDGTSVLASIDVRGDGFDAVTQFLDVEMDWASPVWLRAGRTYRLGYKPTTASPNGLGSALFTFTGTAERQALFGNSYAGSRTGSGSWTDNTLTALPLAPVIDQVSSEKSFVF